MALVVLSCTPHKPAGTRAPYTGPTESMAVVVERINANNRPLRTLWASHDYDAVIYEDNGQRRDVFGSGSLNYRKPTDLLMTFMRDGTVKAFELGSNREAFWMIAPPPGPDTMWWGLHRNIGRTGSRAAEIPIRPDAVLEVLGMADIDTSFLSEPAPVMRFNPDADAYMFVWSFRAQAGPHSEGPARWIAQKEIWYDRRSLLPIGVYLFDENGRVILRAYLSSHQPVEIPGLAPQSWPRLARNYELYFPENLWTLRFRLTEVAPRVGDRPNDRTFEFPTPQRAAVSRIIRVDEAIDE
jgi:hypothetical protein